MILICKRCIPNVFDVTWKNVHVNVANIFWYIVHTIQNFLLKRNPHPKDNFWIEKMLMKSLGVKNQNKVLTYRVIFSWLQS